ncbi:hypothetical protein KKB54_02330 [bacterium]|nr:hypothetical protein [bacterium]MBU1152749.1 hypothetical protein [bacterium]MBU2599093.1 hypothetical protein [bacterium]
MVFLITRFGICLLIFLYGKLKNFERFAFRLLYQRLYKLDKIIDLKEIIGLLEHDQRLVSINSHIKPKGVKN